MLHTLFPLFKGYPEADDCDSQSAGAKARQKQYALHIFARLRARARIARWLFGSKIRTASTSEHRINTGYLGSEFLEIPITAIVAIAAEPFDFDKRFRPLKAKQCSAWVHSYLTYDRTKQAAVIVKNAERPGTYHLVEGHYMVSVMKYLGHTHIGVHVEKHRETTEDIVFVAQSISTADVIEPAPEMQLEKATHDLPKKARPERQAVFAH